jgi:predicted Zn-dependent peptidase
MITPDGGSAKTLESVKDALSVLIDCLERLLDIEERDRLMNSRIDQLMEYTSSLQGASQLATRKNRQDGSERCIDAMHHLTAILREELKLLINLPLD